MSLIRAFRAVFGAHPTPYTEARFWVMRGFQVSDRRFLWIDVAITLALMAGSLGSWFSGIMGFRAIILGWLIWRTRTLERQTPQTAMMYGFLAFVSWSEAAIVSNWLISQNGLNSLSEALTSIVIAIAAVLLMHPVTWITRLWTWLLTAGLLFGLLSKTQTTWQDFPLILLAIITVFGLCSIPSLLALRERQLLDRIRNLSAQTQRKNLELRKASTEITRRNRQLQVSRDWQQDALIANLAKGVVHEMAQPITAASNHLWGVQQRLSDDAELQSVSSNLAQARARLREFRQLFSDPQKLDQSERLDAHEAIQLAMSSLNRTHQGLFEVNAWKEQPNPRIQQSRAVMTQVLLNVFHNAINNRRSEDQPAQITIDIRVCDSHVHFSISNDGKPVDPEMVPFLFEASRSNHADGFGLGLYLSKAILNNTGGEISLKSEADPVCFEVQVELG